MAFEILTKAFFKIVSELRHLPVLDKAGRLLFEGSGANLGIRMSWKPNVTVHLPCISILTPQTSHQTSPSKSSARADSHAATARTSVEFWQPALVCVHVCAFACVCVCAPFASRQCVRPHVPANTDSYSGCVWPASHWEPRRVLQAAAMSEAEACGCVLGVCRGITFTGSCKKKNLTNPQYAHTHVFTHFFCLCRTKIGPHVNTLHTGALRCMNIHLQL